MAKTLNIKFPLDDDSLVNSYFKLNKLTKDVVISDLTLLFLTQKGKRYYNPRYGTNLLKFIFEPNDSITSNEITEDVRNSVKEFMPNVFIKNIDVQAEKDENGNVINENAIFVTIYFEYKQNNFSENGVINITF